jgi:cell volume regulation protein A
MKYVYLVLAVLVLWFAGTHAEAVLHLFSHGSEASIMPVMMSLIAFALVGALGVFLTRGTFIPSFVAYIFLGMAAAPYLEPIVTVDGAAMLLVIAGAVLILMQGGLETPFDNFKKLAPKILSLAFVGLFVTALLTSYVLVWLGVPMSVSITPVVALLLGAILASTDPAAIIPVTQGLKWKDLTAKDTVIAESAVTDVTGALLTVTFLGMLTAGGATIASLWGDGYAQIFTVATALFIVKQVFFGTLAGVVGFFLLQLFTKYKKGQDENHAVDALVFIFVALGSFALALAMGGSGYLAAFVAGLLFHVKDHMKHTEHQYADKIDSVGKAAIFISLGLLVDIQSLIQYAPIGIISAFVFMFIIRPIAVLIALGPFTFFKSEDTTSSVSWRDIAFIAFVRETGAIPAVLLVVVAAQNIPGTEALVPIGMWVIILTLVVQPPLTPWVAKKLGLVE